MVVDVFPIYDILVNQVFGSIGLSIIGIALIISITLLISKVSSTFLMYWMIFYFIVMGTLYLGALALVFGFIFSVTYFFIALIKTLYNET